MLINKTRIAMAGALLAMASAPVFADVNVSISPANPVISPVGANSATITLVFTADGVASSHQGALRFDDAEFNVTNLITVGAGAVCTAPVDNDGTGFETITYSQAAAGAFTAGAMNVCTFVLDHVGVGTGNFPYSFASLLAEEPINSYPVPITGTGGNVTVSAGPPTAPTISYSPTTLNFPAGTAIPQNQDLPVTLTATGGANGGVTAVSCTTSSPGFSIPTNASTCTNTTCATNPLVFRCVSSNAAQSGTATCAATPTNPAGSVVNTTITLNCPAANVAPTLAASPAFDADATSDGTAEVTLPTVGIGQTASGTVAITASGQSGTGSATMGSCSGAGGISVSPATLTFNSNGSQNLTFSCTAAVAQFAGTVSCTETDANSPGVTRLWDVVCPAGTPEAAPNVTYNPVGGTTITFPAGASIGASVAGSTTVAVDINGGIDGGDATPESTSVSCTAGAGFTVTGGSAGPVNAPASAGTDTTVSVSCTSAATAQAGTLNCAASQSVDGGAPVVTNTTYPLNCPAAQVNITSAPAEGNVTLTGSPNSNIPGSIDLTNSGSASTLTCTATGAVTLGAVPANVPAGGSATIPYTCATGAPGVAATGTIQCTTQDPGAEGTLDYQVSCLGFSDVPVPGLNQFGKLLLVTLVIGLGLLGLGARRQ